jgi:REP element-mobilizing transposase RayT
MHWLFEARKRYGLCILNFTVTSNHVHLLVFDSGDKKALPRSIQLIASRTAQEFNQRKNRNGAFWQDRYHATAVENGEHLRQCLVYIDMNMVRAGVVSHPSKWEFCGYNEIQEPRQRYSLIDHSRLHAVAGSGSGEHFRSSHMAWIDEALKANAHQRESRWTESIAVGSRVFIVKLKEELGYRARGRRINESESGSELRERVSGYKAHFGIENRVLSQNSSYFWRQNNEFPAC